jgi:cobalt-precorrin-5B (C1)-methyltransferase
MATTNRSFTKSGVISSHHQNSRGTIMARMGYTLPVFAVAAAKAALLCAQGQKVAETVVLDLLPAEAEISIDSVASIAIEQCAPLSPQSALAITYSDPGDNLDLTRNTPIWAKVELQPRSDDGDPIILEAGEGLGRSLAGTPAIYSYAKKLFETNLSPLISSNHTAHITIILPEGKQLASRTSNAAFGIIDGLSLLGTSGISKPLSTEEHLNSLRQTLIDRATQTKNLIFCIGSNGMQVADKADIHPQQIIQTGNWIGAMLLEAARQEVKSVLLLGYQGKLIKLAGGIFNTSSHLADAKLEILSAAFLRVGGDANGAKQILAAKTADAAHRVIQEQGQESAVFTYLVQQINTKAIAYVSKYADQAILVETVLFDRQGKIIVGEEKLRCRS